MVDISQFPAQIPHAPAPTFRERKMRTNFFCTNFLNTPRGPGHPDKIPGTSQIPLFETQGLQTCLGEGFEKREIPESGYERVQKVFWTQGAKSLLYWYKIGLHRCKTGFRKVQETLGRPLLPGSKRLFAPPLVTTFPEGLRHTK